MGLSRQYYLHRPLEPSLGTLVDLSIYLDLDLSTRHLDVSGLPYSMAELEFMRLFFGNIFYHLCYGSKLPNEVCLPVIGPMLAGAIPTLALAVVVRKLFSLGFTGNCSPEPS